MLHRLLAICIVAFWLTMGSMLVIRELYPESTRLNSVPVSYVGQLVFQHLQSSDLQIQSQGRRVGALHMEVLPPVQPDVRRLDLHGILNLALPGGGEHRVNWLSRIEMSSQFKLRRYQVDLALHEPARRLEIRVDCPSNTAELAVRMGEKLSEQTTITLDEQGLGSLLSRVGVTPAMLQQFQATGASMPPLEFSAQSSSVSISGEKLATFLLTLKAGDQTVFDAHVSPIGQVLRARFPMMGYALLPHSAEQ